MALAPGERVGRYGNGVSVPMLGLAGGGAEQGGQIDIEQSADMVDRQARTRLSPVLSFQRFPNKTLAPIFCCVARLRGKPLAGLKQLFSHDF